MAKKPTIPRAPAGLSDRARGIWRAVMGDWDLGGHERSLLEEALRSLDRAEQARKQVDAEGLTVLDRFEQVKPHPSLSIERDMRGLYARLLREIGLDPSSLESRPPTIANRFDD